MFFSDLETAQQYKYAFSTKAQHWKYTVLKKNRSDYGQFMTQQESSKVNFSVFRPLIVKAKSTFWRFEKHDLRPAYYPGFIFSDNDNTGLGRFRLLGAVQNEHFFTVSNMILRNLYCWSASQNVDFCEKMTYLTVQQGKNQDTKVNKKRVFLWLGDRMCSKVVNSECFNKKIQKSCVLMVCCVKNCLLGLIQLKNIISYDFLMIFILRATAS